MSSRLMIPIPAIKLARKGRTRVAGLLLLSLVGDPLKASPQLEKAIRMNLAAQALARQQAQKTANAEGPPASSS